MNDLIALQAHLQRAVRGQLAAEALKPHWDVRRLLEALEARLEVHLAELKGRLDGLGGRPASLEERVGILLGGIAGRVDRGQRLSRSLRDDYVFLSLLLVTYGVLRVTAATLGDDASADLAGDHLDAIETTADELTVLIPAVVEAELAEATAAG